MKTRVFGATLAGVAACMFAALAIWSPPSPAQIAPMQQMQPAQPVVTRPALTAAPADGPVVRVTRAMRADQIQNLRDDQTIETPSGHRMSVGTLRRLQAAFANARSRHQQRRGASLALQRPASSQGAPRRPGENLTQLLARPDSDVIRLRSGGSMSVAQLRIVAAYLQKHGRLRPEAGARPNLSGPATRVASLAELKSLFASGPDSLVLESPKGTRITLGELRKVMGEQRRLRPKLIAPRGGRQ